MGAWGGRGGGRRDPPTLPNPPPPWGSCGTRSGDVAAAPALCQQPPPNKGALSTPGCGGGGGAWRPPPPPTQPTHGGLMGPEVVLWDRKRPYGTRNVYMDQSCAAWLPTPPQLPPRPQKRGSEHPWVGGGGGMETTPTHITTPPVGILWVLYGTRSVCMGSGAALWGPEPHVWD